MFLYTSDLNLIPGSFRLIDGIRHSISQEILYMNIDRENLSFLETKYDRANFKFLLAF